MGTAAVQYKIMPESPEFDLEEIKTSVNAKIKEMGGVPSSVEETPIAFGLKSLTFSLAFPEEKEVEELGNALESVNGVSSVEMIDYRRALG
jgi:elongation factor 1-beta